MSDVTITDSELGSVSEESSFTGEEEWLSVTKDMELQSLKEMKSSSSKEEKPSDKREESEDEPRSSVSEEGFSGTPNTEENERDISVADTHIRTLLRERFLKLISKLPGEECKVNFFEKTTQTCTIHACDPYFQNLVVENLTTHYHKPIPRAIIRVGDIISMNIEVDDIARFS